MLKFYFPQNLEKCREYLSDEDVNHDLIMIAEEDRELKAICTFLYSKSFSRIHHIISIGEKPDLLMLDGLFRTVMFHLMEMECTNVLIESTPVDMDAYFERLGFIKESKGWSSDHFPDLLFSGCSGCRGEKS